MGLIKLSQKVKRPPVVGVVYWTNRGLYDFMPSVAYDVPVEGGRPSDDVIASLRRRIGQVEHDLNPDAMVGVHIEVHDNYLTITVGSFAT